MEQRSPKKEDQRVRVTKMLLRDAFLAILNAKPIEKITVKELCANAGVNRGTFYLHYKDIYDLQTQLEDEMFDELMRLLDTNRVVSEAGQVDTQREFIQSVFEFYDNNREMATILLGDNGNRQFLSKMVEAGKEKSIREYLQIFPQVSLQQAEILYAYVSWGVVGLVRYSIQNPDVPLTLLAISAEKLIAEGSQFFV